jgi:parallel beta-helix repeat protein
MKREVLTLALLVALPFTLFGAIPAQASTKISSFGYMITASGTYDVTQDLSGSGNAITVLASNVALHLGGHTLSGDGSSGAGVDVQDNTCSGSEIGIAVGDFGFGGVSRNTIQSNTANLNLRGIVIELDYPQNSGNTLQGNTALTNANVDLEDDNSTCVNTWANNTFATDLLGGASDGGPGVGCIR